MKVNKEELKELSEEVLGTMALINKEYTTAKVIRLAKAVKAIHDLGHKQNAKKKEVIKKKNLQHKRFQKALMKEFDYETEKFELEDQDPKDNFKMKICGDRMQTERKEDIAIWLNYETRSVIIYINKEAKKFKKLIDKYYTSNKSYNVEITSDENWRS